MNKNNHDFVQVRKLSSKFAIGKEIGDIDLENVREQNPEDELSFL